MEKRDLYDENKKLTGKTIFKVEETPENYYILVVVLLLQNDKDEFLIQKRSPEKGGEWAFTGGHPKAGESSLEGMHTEVKEEIGIDINKPILFKEASGKNVFCDLYYIKQNVDLNDIKLTDGEVDDVKYASISEINKLYKEGKFKKGHYNMFLDCLDYLGVKYDNNN